MPNAYTSLTALFTAIADALRARSGGTAAIAAQSFPEAIAALPSGTDTSDATAGAGDILSGKTAYALGEKLTGTVPSLAAATITPGTADQTLAAGQYLAGAQTVAGDAGLTAGNIKKGVTLFGVAGTLPALQLTPVHLNLSGGYLYGGSWIVSEGENASDVYPVRAGYRYAVGVGPAVGNKMRASYLATDPAGATATISGTRLGNDISNPPAFSVMNGSYAAPADGFIVVNKGSSNPAATDSFVLELNAMGPEA